MNRKAVFLLSCIPTRFFLAWLLYIGFYLHILAPACLAIAIGFLVIWVFGLRKTGLETNNQPIYWDNQRPIHALFYFAAAMFAFYGYTKEAALAVALDALFGLAVFAHHHFL